MLTVDERLPMPLYHQIFLVLRNKIIDGEFVDGDLLPSEEETARSCGVSHITAKRARNEWAEDGLAVRERGRGTRLIRRSSTTPVRAAASYRPHRLRPVETGGRIHHRPLPPRPLPVPDELIAGADRPRQFLAAIRLDRFKF